MDKELENLAPSKASAAKTLFATLNILKEAGGQLPGKQVIDKIRDAVTLTEWEQQVYEKTGYVRWQSILHFYTIDAIKAGFLCWQSRKGFFLCVLALNFMASWRA